MAARNNQERVGARKKAPTTPPVTNDNTTSFSFASPTEIVELPSRGRTYPDGHPLCGVDTIEIRYMTAKDEDILTSASLLKQGVAIERMLQNVIVDKNISVDDLLVGDKNALIVASRVTGYGPQYNTTINCPSCFATVKQSFDLSEKKMNYGFDLEKAEAKETEHGTFIVDLPVSKVKLELRLLTGRDEKRLLDLAENRRRNNLPEGTLTDQFGLMIVSVNGDNQPSTINSFIDVMPAMDAQHARYCYVCIMPNLDLNQDFSCTSCGHKQEVELPFTADFFWPKR